MEVVCNWLTAHMQSNNHFRDVVKDMELKVKYEAWTNVNSTCSVDTHSDIGLLYYYYSTGGVKVFFFFLFSWPVWWCRTYSTCPLRGHYRDSAAGMLQ